MEVREGNIYKSRVEKGVGMVVVVVVVVMVVMVVVVVSLGWGSEGKNT